MHLSNGNREACVGKPAHETRRRRGSRGGSECFDEKHLEEARQNGIARGPLLAGLVHHQLHEDGQPVLAANVDEFWEKRNQQGRIRRAKDAIAHQQTNVGRAAWNAMPRFTVEEGDGRWIDRIRCWRFETGHGEAVRRRDQDKVSRLEREQLLADLEAARPVEDHAVEGPSRFRTANSPSARAADDFGELGSRVKQRDHFGKRVDNDWTLRQ